MYSSKHPSPPSVLLTFIKQLKIDLLLQNSYWKSSLQNSISPKPKMQQEKYINKAFNENTWVWLKTDMKLIVLMFSLEFCLQSQLLIPIKLFYLLTRQWLLSRYYLCAQLNFLLRKKCHFSICAIEKVCYCFPSPGPQEPRTASWTWLQKPELVFFSFRKQLSNLHCVSKWCCGLEKEGILCHKGQIFH